MKEHTRYKDVLSCIVSCLAALAVLCGVQTPAFAADAVIEQGEYVSYQGTSTCPFYVDGRLAYCAEHRKESPETGETVQVIPIDNDLIKTILYYGWGGDGNRYTDYAQGLVTTHHALNHVYTGEWIVENHRLIAEELVNFAGEHIIHDMNVSFDKTKLQAYLDGEVQRTELITLLGDARNSVSFTLPEAVILHKKDSEETQQGKVTVRGGESFYLTAPYTGASEIATGELFGSMGVLSPVVLQTGDPNTQTCVMMNLKEKGTPTSLQVTWLTSGACEIQKVDSETGESSAQGQSSFAGAEYTVYDEAMSMLTVIVLDEHGYGKAEGLPLGEAVVAETKAPAGYYLDPQSYPIRIAPQATVQVMSKDAPVRGTIELQKHDQETGETRSQIIGESFQGAVYEVFQQDTVIGEIVLDAQGHGQLSDVLHGVYQIKEKTAPAGYLLDDTVYTVEISEHSPSASVYLTQVSDVPIRGGIEIVKTLESSEVGSTDPSLADIIFTITNLEDPTQVVTITTDALGRAATGARELLYGTYKIEESNTPEGFAGFPGDYEVHIEKDAEILQYVIENNRIKCPVRILKIAKDTGKLITESYAEFMLQKLEDGQWRTLEFELPVTDATEPLPTRTQILKTDDSGALTLPTMLDVGHYRVVEVKAPVGYEVNETCEEFDITAMGGWEEPLTISVADQVLTGKIKITKIDAKTGNTLTKGVEFKIRAAEEIRTADGTVRLRPGEIADMIITDDTGIACSKDLYPGKYVITETKAADGYELSTEEYPVALAVGEDGAVILAEIKIKNTPSEVITPAVTPQATVTHPGMPGKSTTSVSGSVKTSDNTQLLLLAVILLASVSVGGVCIYTRIRRKMHSVKR